MPELPPLKRRPVCDALALCRTAPPPIIPR